MSLQGAQVFQWGGQGALLGTSRAPLAGREGLVVELRQGELRGLGEAAPYPGLSRESLDEVLASLRALDWGALRVPTHSSELAIAAQTLLGQGLAPSARFAIEAALAELAALRAGTSVARWLEPEARRELPRSVLLGRGADAALVGRARAAVARGARSLKVKASSAAEALAAVRALSTELSDEVALRLDLGGALRGGQGIREARALASALAATPNLELLEEPCAGAAMLELGPLAVPVFADESLADASLADALLQCEHLQGVVLKPTLLGLARSLELAAAARAWQTRRRHARLRGTDRARRFCRARARARRA
ncbi:MAG: hypothetical protein U0271_43160 [Polyangiaceae bacterium]